MVKPKRRIMVSLLFCFGTICGWGFGNFFIYWRAYLDEHNTWHPEQPLAVSIILASLGNIIAVIILISIWRWRPFEWIKRDATFWSCLTGVLISFGQSLYIVTANQGLPAVIGSPVIGMHVLIPPLWYWLYERKCISINTALGFTASMASLILLSGLPSESISYTISSSEWLVLAMITLSWGMGIITQANSGKDIKFHQFPQILISYTVGYTCCSIVYAFIVSISDVFDPSNYTPFGVDQLLAISSVLFAGLGSGFFFVCLSYTDDVSLMVALASLSIIIPAIFGVLFLHEQVTWNIIVGLICALAAMMILSIEANEEDEDDDSSGKDNSILWSMGAVKDKVNEMPRVSTYSTL